MPFDIGAILLAIKAGAELITEATNLVAQVQAQGTDPTPDQIQAVHDRRAAAEKAWADAIAGQ